MKSTIKLLAISAGALCLSGCASIFGGHQAAADSSQNLDMEQIYHEYAVEQLELARTAMKAGAYAAALDPLRRAAKDRRSAPAAYNAMGVVYAKLDRAEVAERLFSMALVLEPENKAFAANFLKLKGEQRTAEAADRQFAQSGNGEMPAAQAHPPTIAAQAPVQVSGNGQSRVIASTYGTVVTANAGSGQTVRISEHEVRIGMPRSVATAPRSSVAAAEYPARLEFRQARERLQGNPPSRPSYVQRVTF